MKCLFKSGTIEIWSVLEPWGTDFYVYGVTASGDPRVCPSYDMAREAAAQ